MTVVPSGILTGSGLAGAAGAGVGAGAGARAEAEDGANEPGPFIG